LGAVPGDIRIILDAPGGMQFMQTIAYRDGDGIDWLVISTIPETDFMSDITAGDRRTIVIVLGSVLLAVLLAAIAARWVTRPILQLNDAARMLAGGDFTGKAPIERRDEIGELARSFSSMAGQLRTSFSSLQESEERYRKLFDGLPIGLYRSTLVGVLLDANPAAVQILGFPDRETLLACDIQTLFVDPEDSAVWRERLKWEGIVKDYEVNIRRRDGRLIWVRTTCIVVRGSGGDVLSYEGSLEEVTERVRAEEALRESEEKFRILSEQSQIGICIVQDGTFAYVNPVFTTFTGFGSGDSVFKLGGWREGPAPDPRLIEALTTLFKQPDPFGTPRLTPSARLRTPSGEDRYFNVYLKAVHLGGKPAGMAALVDITEEKEAQAKAAERQGQLIRAEKLASLGVLAAGVAHEISNPNQAILLSGQVIRDAWLDVGSTLDEKAGEEGDFSIGGIPYSQAKEMIPNCLSAIMECSQRIETIVNDLKGFARQDQAGAFRPIDLNMVVKSSLTLCANMLKKSTDALTVRLAPDLPPVNGSYQRLEQVVINLVQNACQALPDSTRGIDICTRYDPVAREVVLEVSDQGVGIPSDDLSRIGDPFFTTKRETGGTGLGLSISTSIMQEHGGRLAYTSKPGEGTTAVVAIRRIE
jgi:PAS domain S-box-containing protein